MTTLLLIRHGQTPSNVVGALDTALPGAGLTVLGVRQAEDLVRRLEGQRIDRIAASRHRRALLTAAPLARARGLEIPQDPGFGEIEAGALEMARTHEAAEEYLRTALSWAKGDLRPRLPGGPDGAETIARFTTALDQQLTGLGDDDTLAVVSHGAIIRLWVTSQANGITAEDLEHTPLPNTTVVRLEGRPGSWNYVSWNEPTILDLDADDPTSQADEGDASTD